MNRIFSGIGQEVSQNFPAVNVWVGENDAMVKAEIPGAEIEKIDISVIVDSLTISGSREPVTLGEGESYHRQERDFGRFTRTLQLPFNVEVNKVDARYENGILSITLPRAEADKPKKVAIKTQ
jgi:HSP20 family protein